MDKNIEEYPYYRFLLDSCCTCIKMLLASMWLNLTKIMLKKKKSNKNVYIVYYFIFIKFKSRQNLTMVLEVGIVAILRNRVVPGGNRKVTSGYW